jgi:hypothetical protein
MNKVRLALVLAVALVACGRESTTGASADSVSFMNKADRGYGSLESKMGAAPPPAPPVAAPVALTAEVREEAQGSTQSRGMAANQDGALDATGANPLQGVNYSTTSSASTMVIRTGQAFIKVEKVDPAMLKMRQLVVQVGGYITNSSISGGKDQIRQASIEIKIPNTKYDQAVGSLSSIGEVETVNSNAQDVGEEFVDVTARVANARRLEDRLIDLLAKRTGKLDEVLRVERELARVREEIERYEGRLRYLTARVAMSTLTVNIHEPAPIIEPGRSPIAEAFRRAWQNFVAMVAAVIASLGVLIPIGLIGVGGWIGYRRWIKGNRPLTA